VTSAHALGATIPRMKTQSKRKDTESESRRLKFLGMVIATGGCILAKESSVEIAGIYAAFVGGAAYLGSKYISGETSRPSGSVEAIPPISEVSD